MNNFNKQSELTFKDIIFRTIKVVGEKSFIEFKGGGKRIVDHGTWNETLAIPDSRLEYIQAVEHLSDLLMAELNKDALSAHEKIMEKLVDNLKKVKEKKKEMNAEDYIDAKLELMRSLFRNMMLNLKNSDYLKSVVIGESATEDIDIEED